jgi:5-methyltetrahydropteroyltriglutamate--homocysteine methyltransferase
MERSRDRILTTHAGSLPRPPELVRLLQQVSQRESVDEAELERTVDAAVADVVERQRTAGIDIGNDGEQGRESFFTYVQHRMTGFAEGATTSRTWKDIDDFPGFAAIRRAQRSTADQVTLTRPPVATGEVSYPSTSALDAECSRLASHLVAGAFTDAFMSSPSPGIVAAAMSNQFYPSLEDYLGAIGTALSVEYHRIVEAGFVLQIDAPDLAMEHHGLFADRPVGEFLEFVERVVAIINEATAGLPADRIRLHVCWGNYGGPHVHDIPLADLLPLLYQARIGGLLISGGNPRHEHEYREFQRQPLPDGWMLAAGVIDTTTNYVEHPEVVADRLERVARAVGDQTRIVACTDCGFDTAAGFGLVAPDVAWAKLRSLHDGAERATERLF